MSVVVPTYGRAERIPRTIAAIRAQRHVQGSVELIVVDDASPDGTAQTLEALAAEDVPSVRMRVLRLPRNSGPAVARNAGWRAATAPIIAFTDDDCVPRPGWLAAVLTAAADADIVEGRTLPDPQSASIRGPFSHTVDVPRFSDHYQTCNIAYRRSVLEQCNGFDEGFRYPYGEDVDLGLRAVESGARAVFAPDAVVEHDVSPSSFMAQIRNLPREEGQVLAVRRHPAFRSKLHRQYWLRPSHPPALMAGGALALGLYGLARRRLPVVGAAAAATLPYVDHRLRRGRLFRTRSHLPWVVPQALMLDLAEIAVLLRGSFRHRTLVL